MARADVDPCRHAALPRHVAGSRTHRIRIDPIALLALGLHTVAMLAAIGTIAAIVYKWTGVAFLRRGWINLDLLWTIALVACGISLLIL
jgi:hypothetical protein